MRGDIGAILTTARRKGITADAKWGLDVAGTAPPRVLAELLRAAFNDRSQVLRDSAYRQIAKLNNIPSDLAFSIRATLTRMTLTGRLRKERTATYAHLSRLTNPSNFLATLRLLLWLPTLDLAVHILLLLIMFLYSFVLWFQTPNDYFSAVVLLLAIVFVPITYLSFYSNVNLVPRLVRLFDR